MRRHLFAFLALITAAENVPASDFLSDDTDTAKFLARGGLPDAMRAAVDLRSAVKVLQAANGGDLTLTPVGSTPSANGASLLGQALTLQPADATYPGLITAGTQTIGGAKTFSANLTAPGFFPSAEDFIFYVDPGGSDENDCKSESTPCETLQAAIAKLPPYWQQKCRIILAAGTYTNGSVYYASFGYPVGQGEPLVIQGAMVDSGLGERTITAVSTIGSYVWEVTDDTLTPTLDEYVGYFIRITSGDGAGVRRMIRNVTTGGKFSFNNPDVSNRISPGDKFVIEKPGSIISNSSTIVFSSTGTARLANILFSSVAFENAASGGSVMIGGGTKSFFHASTMSLGAKFLTIMRGASLQAEALVGIADDILMKGLYSMDEFGSGLYLNSTSSQGIFTGENVLVQGYFQFRGGMRARVYGPGTHFRVYAIDSVGCKIELNSGADGEFTDGLGLAGRINSSTGDGLTINGGTVSKLLGTEFSDNTNSGVLVTYFGTLSDQGTITGTGNGAAGIDVQLGSKVTKSASTSTVTGTAGEIRVGTFTTTHAAVWGGTPLWDAVGGQVIKNTTPGTPALTVAGLTIGTSGTAIASSVRCTATLGTSEIAAGATAAQDIECTGAAVGAECAPGGAATLETGLIQSCVVTSADHVGLRTANVTASPITPAGSQTVSVRVFNP